MNNISRPQSKSRMPSDAKRVFDGVIFDVYHWPQVMYDGSVATFERLKRPDTTTIFPVLPDGRILLSKQLQPDRAHPFIHAFGGQIEEGEDVMAAAARELREESGYAAKSWTLWKAYQPYSKIDWALYVFIAHGVEKVADQDLDPGEKIDVFAVTFDEFVHMVLDDGFEIIEIMPDLYQALLNPAKMQALKRMFLDIESEPNK